MNPQLMPIAILVLVAIGWGQGFPLVQIALQELTPFEAILLRLGIAAIALTPFLFVHRRSLKGLSAKTLGLVALLGLIGLAGFNLFATIGQGMGTPAGITGVLVSSSPIFTAILARYVSKERVPTRRKISLLISFAGVVLVTASTGLAGGGSPLAVLIILIAPLCTALASVLSQFISKQLPPLFSTALAMWIATLAMLPAVPMPRLSALASGLSPTTWGAMLVLALFSTAFSYAGWYWGFSKLPAAKAGAFAYLVPVFGLAGSFAMLGERPDPIQWVGIAIVFVGMAMDLMRRPVASESAPSAATL
ncbi:MAG TPA: DMT family transporter [Pantanalinema sp.]